MVAEVNVTSALEAGIAAAAVRLAPPVDEAKLSLKSHWPVMAACPAKLARKTWSAQSSLLMTTGGYSTREFPGMKFHLGRHERRPGQLWPPRKMAPA